MVIGIEPDNNSENSEVVSTVRSEFAYITGEEIEASDMANVYLGAAGMMTVSGQPQLEVRHALPSPAQSGEGMVVLGKFDVRTTEEGWIRLSGYATKLWKGDVRVSPTRWESLNEEWKRWMLAGAAAALLAILRLIFPLLWKNRNKSI